MVDEFYQISIHISGKLLDFSVEDHNFNKYKTGTGRLLVFDGQTAQIFPITAGKELIDTLNASVGTYIDVSGAVRNYRCNDEKYNVIRVYSVEPTEMTNYINSVQATCEVIGLMTKPSLHAATSVKAAQLYLLTNEKYDKHTRLNAVIFGTSGTPLLLDSLPKLGGLHHFKGYLQLDRVNQQIVTINDTDYEKAAEGKIELVVTDYEEVIA